MQVSQGTLIIGYVLLFYLSHTPSNRQANAENVPENIPESNEDTAQFHNKMSHERRHLLAHLADRMDLDGEGLRHIQRHLGEQTLDAEQSKDLKDVADGDNAKGIFYFFKFHDYDDNQKLDGLEWMQALTDFHQDDNQVEFKEGGKVFLEHEAEAIVDELLSKHDKDDDGMIDYFELMNTNVESFMTELDKPPPGENVDHTAGEQQQQNVEEQSSLEQEFNQRQQNQEQNKEQQDNQPDNQQTQEDQQQQQENNEQQGDQQQQTQDNQQHQEEPNDEERQGDQETSQEQQDNQQQNEPSSLEEEYNQQQQQS